MKKELGVILGGLGFNEKEIAVYHALCVLGNSTAEEISRKTNIKRPTVYHTLIRLLTKGIVSESGEKVKSYTAVTLQRIEGLIQEQKEHLDESKSVLYSVIENYKKHTPLKEVFEVRHFKGVSGVKSLFDMAFRANNKKWDIIAPYKNILREYDEEYAKYYLKAREYYKITSRTLWEKTMERTLTIQEQKNRNVRFMPEVMQNRFNSMMILFDDSVVIFSSLSEISGVCITSKESSLIFKTMFEFIWSMSTKYKEGKEL